MPGFAGDPVIVRIVTGIVAGLAAQRGRQSDRPRRIAVPGGGDVPEARLRRPSGTRCPRRVSNIGHHDEAKPGTEGNRRQDPAIAFYPAPGVPRTAPNHGEQGGCSGSLDRQGLLLRNNGYSDGAPRGRTTPRWLRDAASCIGLPGAPVHTRRSATAGLMRGRPAPVAARHTRTTAER